MTEQSNGDNLVEMSWDPITRIVGSLGVYTKIDFGSRRVVECHSTSSIFRGYSVFTKGKDPRDAHFITSRICGICGDNHATCACYAQNMAFGIGPPSMAEWIINLGEAAEYMFDHNLFQDNLVGVDFCEKMVRETNPGVFDLAEKTDINAVVVDLKDYSGKISYDTAVPAAARNRTRPSCCMMYLAPRGVRTFKLPIRPK